MRESEASTRWEREGGGESERGDVRVRARGARWEWERGEVRDESEVRDERWGQKEGFEIGEKKGGRNEG